MREVVWCLLVAAVLAAAGCRRATPSGQAAPAASAPASSSGARRAAPPRKPGPFDALRNALVREAQALLPDAQALVEAAEKGQRDEAKAAYRALRRRNRKLEPAARRMARVASSQLGAYGFFEPSEQAANPGLPGAGRLLWAERLDAAALATAARRLLAAARLLPGELESQDWTAERVGLALSEGAFVLGARLDGSDSLDEDERWSDVEAEIEGMLLAVALSKPSLPAAEAEAIEQETRPLRAARARVQAGGRPGDVLGLIAATGKLGAALRRGFGAAGGGAIDAPFRPLRDGGLGALAPVSVLTFPARPGPAPDGPTAALGRALFGSKLLSRPRTVACASCHDERHAFARPDPPAQTFDHKLPPRNAPGLWNVAYEPFHFWDGRASTLVAQIDVAVDRDMGGDWAEVEARLSADADATALARAAGSWPLTAERTKQAIVAFERTLIEDNTRLDRHVRGEAELGAEEQRGADLFFGKARCSRCHRPPMLSGAIPPRFFRTEMSAIGAPTRPGGHDLGVDAGRFAVTHDERDRGLFKVPGLRRVAETAPYFHHGGFATLEQVIDFYDKGGGPGLGISTPNADPELVPLKLEAPERAALLAFLKAALGR